MKFYTITCEWDIGINDKSFISEEVARAHTKAAMISCGVEDITIYEAEDAGLVSFQEHDTADIISEMPKHDEYPEPVIYPEDEE